MIRDVGEDPLSPALRDIKGSFSIDDGDGRENVTFKVNWRFFKLFRVYSNSVKMSKEGKFL